MSDAATVLRALDGWLEHYNAVHPHKVQGYRWPRELRKADGGGRDGQCGRRSVSTGGSTLCTAGDRVKSEAAAARRCKSSGLTRAQLWTTHEDPNRVRLFRGNYSARRASPKS